MGMMPFYTLFPEEAESECRAVVPAGDADLPDHGFLLMELYCSEPQCDCRRVLLNVIDTATWKHVATINHGFEPPTPPHDADGQTFLDPLNPQSSISAALLQVVADMIDADEEYRRRLERHYALWKGVVDDPAHPDQARLRGPQEGESRGQAAGLRQEPFRRTAPKVGANDPCPCGSGKKFKRCCRP